ncbi:MAG: hypothetical protein HRT35_18140 [Algicola sp.]|nr:hypothetical protein [Algicola sp.]
MKNKKLALLMVTVALSVGITTPSIAKPKQCEDTYDICRSNGGAACTAEYFECLENE